MSAMIRLAGRRTAVGALTVFLLATSGHAYAGGKVPGGHQGDANAAVNGKT